MEVITIMLEVIYESMVSLVSSITLMEFCLLSSLVLLVTISRRLGFIHTSIQETKGAIEEIREIVDTDTPENTEPLGKVEPKRKVDSQEKIYPQI